MLDNINIINSSEIDKSSLRKYLEDRSYGTLSAHLPLPGKKLVDGNNNIISEALAKVGYGLTKKQMDIDEAFRQHNDGMHGTKDFERRIDSFEIGNRYDEEIDKLYNEMDKAVLEENTRKIRSDISTKTIEKTVEDLGKLFDENTRRMAKDEMEKNKPNSIPNTPLFYGYFALKDFLENKREQNIFRISKNYRYGYKYYRSRPRNGFSGDKKVMPKTYEGNFVVFSSTESWAKDGKNSVCPRNFGWSFEPGRRSLAYNEEDRREEINEKKSKVAFTTPESGLSPASLLGVTDKLFRDNKISTMVNRFFSGTGDGSDVSIIQTALTKKYGLSKGRNLLRNGMDLSPERIYENPYCRVWTQLRQYDRFESAIRSEKYDEVPYYSENNEGRNRRNPEGVRTLSEWSPLTETGRVRIAPTNNEDIKKCMFSIENLAWKDNDILNYQKGENGGRIMWFPPYNLKFNEQVTANWNGNKFIGRGEDIFTYTNSERNGTLSFTMLIDHPSCVNEWNLNKEGTLSEEEDMLRFFAGCGDIKENLVPEKEEGPGTYQIKKYGRRRYGPNVYTSLVFFPHNYSGNTDWNVEDAEKRPGTPLDYIYCGKGYEFSGGDGYEMKKTSALSKDIEIPDKGWYYRTESYITDEENIPVKKDLTSRCLNSDVNVIDRKEIQKLIGPRSKSFFVTFEELYDLFANGNKDTGSLAKKTLWKFLGSDRKCNIRINGFVPKVGNEKFCTDVASERVEIIKRFFEKTGFPTTPVYNMKNRNVATIRNTEIPAEKDKVYYETNVRLVDIDTENKELIDTDESKLMDFVLIEFEVLENQFMDFSYGRLVREQIKDKNYRYDQFTKNITSNLYNLFYGADYIGKRNKHKKEEELNRGNEYYYFRDLKKNDKVLYERLNEKIQYFNPAFHSITPEGFNERLTFLQQCTRQGPTKSAPDVEKNDYQGYGNLAFGRPPYCVLRIGDFFNTKIIIDSISIDYGDNQWDMNPEGVGIQPMLANISINFKFMGGADLSGPIEKLQNAVSFNYYSNASVYDERALRNFSPIKEVVPAEEIKDANKTEKLKKDDIIR